MSYHLTLVDDSGVQPVTVTFDARWNVWRSEALNDRGSLRILTSGSPTLEAEVVAVCAKLDSELFGIEAVEQ